MGTEGFKDFISRENPDLYNEVKEEVQQEYKKRGGLREGAGRKKHYENKVKKTFELEKDDVICLEEYAKQHKISRNKALHEAIHNLIRHEA